MLETRKHLGRGIVDDLPLRVAEPRGDPLERLPADIHVVPLIRGDDLGDVLGDRVVDDDS